MAKHRRSKRRRIYHQEAVNDWVAKELEQPKEEPPDKDVPDSDGCPRDTPVVE